jgi:hypothetical protein
MVSVKKKVSGISGEEYLAFTVNCRLRAIIMPAMTAVDRSYNFLAIKNVNQIVSKDISAIGERMDNSLMPSTGTNMAIDQ